MVCFYNVLQGLGLEAGSEEVQQVNVLPDLPRHAAAQGACLCSAARFGC